MSRLARRRGHAGSCPTRLGRGAIRGAAKKQTPTRAPRQRVARIWRSCASDARWRACRAAGARSAVARAARRTLADAETAVFDANILAGAATAARKVRDAAIVSVCARTRLCVAPVPRGAFVARTRDAPLAWPRRSSLLVDAIHLGVGGRNRETFSGSGLFKPRTTSQGVETEPKRRVYVRARTRRSLWKFGNLVPPRYPLFRSESREIAVGGEPR